MRIFLIPLLTMFVATGALAQSSRDGLPEAGEGYELREAGQGFVRLNRRSGAMSYCRVVTGNLVCQSGEEERDAYLGTIDTLESRLKAAEERIARLERGLRELGETNEDDSVADDEEGTESGRDRMDSPLTEEERNELDRAVEFADRAMRRFFGVVKELREDLESRSR